MPHSLFLLVLLLWRRCWVRRCPLACLPRFSSSRAAALHGAAYICPLSFPVAACQRLCRAAVGSLLRLLRLLHH